MSTNIKINQLSTAVTSLPNDYLLVVQGGIYKKSTITNILHNLDATDTIRINPSQRSLDCIISSKNVGPMLIIKGSSDRIGIGTSSPAARLHVEGGNLQIGSSTTDGVVVQSTETIQYTASDQVGAIIKSISPMKSLSILNNATGTSGLFSLSNGFNGAYKSIAQNVTDNGKTSTITCTGLGFNTIEFTASGQSVLLQYNESISKWIIISNNGATISTV